LALTGSPVVNDNCDVAPIITYADAPVPTTCGGDYKIVRTWTATDHCGNSNSAKQDIFVQDIGAPVISALPAPFTIDCNDTPVFAVATAIDACASTFTLTFADVTTPGTCANNYSINRTWTAKDACGNTSTATQTINVQDVVAPVITCPANLTGFAGVAECGASGIVLIPATATDNCSIPTVVGARNDGRPLTDPFPVGVTSVVWTASDACGNSSTCTQTITINDNNLPPTITCPANVVQTALPGNCTLSSVVIPDPTYADNCAVTKLTWALSGATTGNSPATGINSASGQTFNVGVTTVTYTASDAVGNSASCFFTVTIQSPAIPNINRERCFKARNGSNNYVLVCTLVVFVALGIKTTKPIKA